jgi:hypothetical protein
MLSGRPRLKFIRAEGFIATFERFGNLKGLKEKITR